MTRPVPSSPSHKHKALWKDRLAGHRPGDETEEIISQKTIDPSQWTLEWGSNETMPFYDGW